MTASPSATDPDEPRGDHRPPPADGPFTLNVDDEIFTVTISPDGRSGYAWDSGPNPGYGFDGFAPRFTHPPDGYRPSAEPIRFPTFEEHRRSIRTFLDQVDPSTGYIEE
ncbi:MULTISPECIES: hypothetical protein [Nocardia]|uniref:hypothetical protein n=1 Tax=Nocardia TaxID=1817 RepID=UPI00292E5870|nr:hypothetical protein [Nocardia canadensis]